jgi:hypothetical protein
LRYARSGWRRAAGLTQRQRLLGEYLATETATLRSAKGGEAAAAAAATLPMPLGEIEAVLGPELRTAMDAPAKPVADGAPAAEDPMQA